MISKAERTTRKSINRFKQWEYINSIKVKSPLYNEKADIYYYIPHNIPTIKCNMIPKQPCSKHSI